MVFQTLPDEIKSTIQNKSDKTSLTPLTREALYELVWSEPMLRVAKRFDVSSSYMARVCTLLNVPRPERGYWAKMVVGKATKKPPLPEARPGDELVWSRDGQTNQVERPLPHPPSKVTRKHAKTATNLQGQHGLIIGAKGHFEAGRLSYEADYLKPSKKLLVDLVVSKTGLDKALLFANELFLSLEVKGYRVVIAPNSERFHRTEVDEHETPRKNRGYNNLWSPCRCTVVYIGTLAIGLTIIEMSEEVEVRYINGKYIREKDYVPPKRSRYEYGHSWTTNKNYPTGRLCLQAYSPYWRAQWIRHWRETEKSDLSGQIHTIIKNLEEASGSVALLVEEGERKAEIEQRQWEAQQEQWRREAAEAKAAKALKDSKTELLQIIDNWAESKRIEAFFLDAERKAAELRDDEKFNILERLKVAREMIGSVEALDHFIDWRSPDER